MKKLITLLICLSVMMGTANAATYYVNIGLVNGNNDGSSWEHAFQTFDAAKTAASGNSGVDNVYIKGSIPSQTSTWTMSVDNYYGSFDGTESSPSERPMNDNDGNGIIEPWEFLYPTTYIANVNGGAINGSAAILDGFTITQNSTVNSSTTQFTLNSPIGQTVRNCVFSGSVITAGATTAYTGGNGMVIRVQGVFLNNLIEKNTVNITTGSDSRIFPIMDVPLPSSGSTSVVISGCVFRNNKATVTPGGASPAATNLRGMILDVNFANSNTATGVSATISNCIFQNNEVSLNSTTLTNLNAGIASSMSFSQSSSVDNYINCLFINNKMTNLGAAMVVVPNATLIHRVYNCAFWNNQNTISSTSATSSVSMRGSAYSGGLGAASVVSNNVMDVNVTGNFKGSGSSTYANNLIDLSTTNTTASKGSQFVNPNSIIGASASFTSGADLIAISQSDWRLNSSSYLIGKGTTTGTALILPVSNIDKSGYNFSPSSPAVGAYEGPLSVTAGNQLVISASSSLKSLTVNAGGQLTINNGVSLNVEELVLESDATGTATLMDSYSTPTISATVKQYVTVGRNWYMSAPLNNTADFSVLDKGASVAEYNEVTGLWPTVSSGTLTRGKGYVQVASSAQGTTGTVSFNGTVNSGDVPVTLTYTSGKGNGFNLVGNPYPSYLSWSAVAADNAAANMPTGTMWYRTISYNGKSAWTPNTVYNVNDIVYNGTRFYKVTTAGTSAASGGPSGTTTGIADNDVVWDYQSSIYIFATISASGVATPSTVSNLVPPMQAFWVKSTGGTLTFKNTMRTHNTGGANALKAPKSAESDLKLLRLNVSNGASADEAVIYASANANNAFDSYDAPKYFNSAGSNQPEIYTQVGNEKLVINAMSEINEGTVIPLGFATEKGNDFSISASEFRNFGSETKVLLKDKETNAEFDLSGGQSYSFSSGVVNNTDRFSLIFRTVGNTTGIDNATKLNIRVFVNAANQITIIAPVKSNYAINNGLGQLIENGIQNTERETRNTKLAAGVYVVKVNNQSTRVIIK